MIHIPHCTGMGKPAVKVFGALNYSREIAGAALEGKMVENGVAVK